MLRRSALALSRRRSSIGRAVSRQSSAPQIFPSVCPRRGYSSIPSQNASPPSDSTSKQTGQKSMKILVAGAAVGACFYAAYSRGYLNDVLGQKGQSSDPLKIEKSSTETSPKGAEFQHIEEPIPVHTNKDSESLNSHVNDAKYRAERQSTLDPVEEPGKHEGDNDSFAEDSSNLSEATHIKEKNLPKTSDDVRAKGEQLSKSSLGETTEAQIQFEDSADVKSSGEKSHLEQHVADENMPTTTDVGAVVQGNNADIDETTDLRSQNEPKDFYGHDESPASLLGTYHLEDKVDDGHSSISGHTNETSPREETSSGTFGDSGDASISKDGKLVFDFLQAIHAAEQRQAELDALFFAKEKRAMKDKYEKELKDARARELMYAEEAAMLEKEIMKERAKAAAALKSLQERAEEKLKKELEDKEREAKSKQKEIQDFAKAELTASIAREKAAQIEKMAEANLNINALCMAFYARSEEARQTHSIHKLALGALALEDALSDGLPVQSELDALRVYIENVDKDSLLQLALSSIPEDVRLHGTDTVLQLNQKFDVLKGKLRHYSLIPPAGGGILAHSLAHVASFLKVKEADQSGDGIESLLNKVESLLAQGKLVEAADVLEDGVKGNKASEVVGDWLRRARNRAIADQALVLLQSYAASVSLT